MGKVPMRFVAAGLTALVMVGCKPKPYSSPTALRDTNAFFKAISPGAPAPLSPTALDQFTASMDGSTLVITRPAGSGNTEPNDGFFHTVKRLTAGGKLEGDGAAFEMLAFSVSGPGISPAPTNNNRNVPLDFFAPDGKILSQEQLKQLGFKKWHLTEYVGDGRQNYWDSFPELKVWFGSSKQPPGYFSPVGCFDAQTGCSLVSGYSYSQISSSGPGSVELRTRAWHAAPIDLVMDVQLDGKFVVQTNATAGMTVSLPGGLIRLLGIWEGDRNSWSSQSGSGGLETMRLTLNQAEGKTNAMAIFVAEPPELAIQCELLDAQGKEFPGRGGGTAGGFRMTALEGRVEDVQWVRFTVYTNHHRVVLRIPPVPKLPSGQSVANLFEVPIPLVTFNRQYELRDYIGSITQMKFQYPSLGDNMPTNLFPMTVTNTTPAELLTLYRRNITNTMTVVVDQKKQEIRLEPTLWEKALRWVKQKLKL